MMARPGTELRTRKRMVLVSLLIAVGIFVLACTLARLMASRWWLADALTQFTVQYLFLLLPVVFGLMLLRQSSWALLFLLPLVANLWIVKDYILPPSAARKIPADSMRLRVMTHNVLRSNTRYEEVASLIREYNPDFVALQEIDPLWLKKLDSLRSAYPYIQHQDQEENFGIAFLSRIPWEEADVQWNGAAKIPSLHFRFLLPGGIPLELVNVHAMAPVNRAHAQERNAQLLLTARGMDRERVRILAGDFNLSPWSPWFRELLARGKLFDTASGRGLTPTWHRFPTLLGGVRIDHVLASPEVVVENYQVARRTGSDHRAVIVDLAIPDPSKSRDGKSPPAGQTRGETNVRNQGRAG